MKDNAATANNFFIDSLPALKHSASALNPEMKLKQFAKLGKV
jgi:hypothetical protein